MAKRTVPRNQIAPAPANEQQQRNALAPLLAKINRAHLDGAAGATDPQVSSQAFLRRVAFARESLLQPNDDTED